MRIATTQAERLVQGAPFWPPADHLLVATERIRAQLGDWPEPARRFRFCLSTPSMHDAASAVLPDDVIVLASLSPDNTVIQSWLARGAAVLDVLGERTVLLSGTSRIELLGRRSEDWLAALPAFADCGFALHDALVLALAWREGGGWPTDVADFPKVPGLPKMPRPFAACPDQLGLYPVVPDADWVARLIDVGVRTIQLRSKSTDPAFLRDQIGRAVAAARAAPDEIRLFINDHWQLAIDAGAYGIHLGQEDLLTADCAAIAAAGLRLGLSTHGYYEILRALPFQPSYIACGAVFETATKAVATPPQGLAQLACHVRLLRHVRPPMPVVAIGGIDLERLPKVLATGVGSAAVVSAVTKANDLIHVVAALQSPFNHNRAGI